MKFIDLVAVSKRAFLLFVDECNNTYRLGDDLRLYRDIFEMHKNHASMTLLLENDLFYSKIYETLIAWNMNQRGARLARRQLIKDSVISLKNEITRLYNLQLEPGIQLTDEFIGIIRKIFMDLKVMESKRKLVGTSKVMHFLFPDLIVPIDSKYTLNCFYNYNRYDNSPNREFRTFMEICQKCIKIVNKLNLTKDDVNGERWNTSVPKLIDNAIIGFFRFVDSHEVSEVINLLKTT